MARLTEAEWATLSKTFKVGQLATPAKRRSRSKYNARAVVVTPHGQLVDAAVAKQQGIEGIRFASKREADYYVMLLGRLDRVEITGLVLQPAYDCHGPDGKKICTYRADFRYVDVATGTVVTVDVKGMRTPVYRLKKKLVEAEYGITVHEV
jgi:hypothetical protein